MSSLESRIENLPNSSAPKHAEPPGAARDVAGILDTYMEKERRKCNIVVHNLKEAEEDTHDVRITADMSRLTALFKDAFRLQVNPRPAGVFGQTRSAGGGRISPPPPA